MTRNLKAWTEESQKKREMKNLKKRFDMKCKKKIEDFSNRTENQNKRDKKKIEEKVWQEV